MRRLVAALVAVAACSPPAARTPARLAPPAPAHDEPFRAAPPAFEPAEAFRPPRVRDFTLANGLRVRALHQPGPLVTVHVTFLAASGSGALYNVLDAELTTRTAHRSAAQVDDLLSRCMAWRAGFYDVDAMVVGLTMASDKVAEAIPLLADFVRAPAFSATRMTAQAKYKADGLAGHRAEPGPLAHEAWLSGAFGPSSAYGRNAQGTPDELRALTHAEVVAAYTRIASPKTVTIEVAGGFDPVELRPTLEQAFEGWTGAPGAVAQVPLPLAVPPVPDRQAVVAEAGGGAMAALVFGARALSVSDADYPAILALLETLRRRVNARLFDDQALTDAVYVSLDTSRATRSVRVHTDVPEARAAGAVAEIEAVWRALRDTPVPAPELATAVQAVRWRNTAAFERSRDIATFLTHMSIHDVPSDWLTTLDGDVAKVTPAEVQRVARGLLDLDHAVVAVAGSRAVLMPALGAAGFSARDAVVPP